MLDEIKFEGEFLTTFSTLSPVGNVNLFNLFPEVHKTVMLDQLFNILTCLVRAQVAGKESKGRSPKK